MGNRQQVSCFEAVMEGAEKAEAGFSSGEIVLLSAYSVELNENVSLRTP
ncbi:hypothetical protein MNBD_DELTA04-839 [hydrothermal vent metagenome]|uniref:Uncharacterized protein n=1 Tax=hydrothermal vent metagenome TaxID=652676 RepID=A0A3B0VD87_9ZZZZ